MIFMVPVSVAKGDPWTIPQKNMVPVRLPLYLNRNVVFQPFCCMFTFNRSPPQSRLTMSGKSWKKPGINMHQPYQVWFLWSENGLFFPVLFHELRAPNLSKTEPKAGFHFQNPRERKQISSRGPSGSVSLLNLEIQNEGIFKGVIPCPKNQ